MAKLLTGTRIYGTGTVDTQLFVSGATATSSTNTGALQVVGGAGIGGGLVVGGTVTATTFVGAFSGTVTGSASSVANSVTFNNGGTGDASGTAFNGSAARTISYNTLGAMPTTGGTFSGPVTFTQPVTFGGTATYILSTNTWYTDNVLELHVPPSGVTAPWFVDDGKDIGLRFHYYTAGTDTNAALVLDATTKELHWYSSGAESAAGDFSTATYGIFRTGAIRAVVGTQNQANTSTGALTVFGGVGVSGGGFFGGIVTATNFSGSLSGGTAMSVVYQSAANTTAYLAAGSAGQILQTNGTGSAPTWVSVTGLTAGTATTATQLNTQLSTANATYYPTFVDANNASAAAEFFYTTSSFSINPSTNAVSIGGTYGSAKLSVNGAVIVNANDSFFGNYATGDYVDIGNLGSTGNVYFDARGASTNVNVVYRAKGAANHIWYYNGGSNESMRIDSVGTVGIGETSPITYATTGSLVITNTTFRPEVALRTTTAVGGTTAIKLGATTSIPQGGAVISSYISAVSGQPTDLIFSLVTSGTLTERLRITSNGGIAFNGSTNYGSSGQVLQSNGNAAPTWVNPSTLASASATNADNLRTVIATASANYYPSFVDSNNATAAYEAYYTTSSFYINPATGIVTMNNLLMPQNAVGVNYFSTSTQPTYYIGQTNGNDDAWKIYGESPGGTNTGGLILQSEDDFDSNESIRLRFKRAYSAWQTNDVLVAQYNQVYINTGTFQVGYNSAQQGAALAVNGGAYVNGILTATTFVGAFTGAVTGASTQLNTQLATASGTYYPTFVDSNNASATAELHYTTSSFSINPATGAVNINASTSNGKLTIDTPAGSNWMHLRNSSEAAFGLTVFNSGTGSGSVVPAYKIGLTYSNGWNSGINFHRGGSSVGGFISFFTDTDIERLRITQNGGFSFGATGTATGSSGNVLQSNGDAPPTWVAPSTLASASATNADNIRTVATPLSAAYYPALIDSNNASNAYELVYTTSSFQINAASGQINIGSTGIDYQPSSGGNHTLRLNAVNTSSIGFHDSGSTIGNIKFSGVSGFEIGAADGLYGPHNTILHGTVGIGITTPQYKLDVNNGATGSNTFQASFGTTMASGNWSGIHFGYSESGNTSYRKSAIVFERSDATFGDARGKVHILNGPTGSGSATLSDAKFTIDTVGNVGVGTTTPSARLDVSSGTGTNGGLQVVVTGEAYGPNTTSSRSTIYDVAGTVVRITAANNSVAAGALINFNAYNASNGATGAFAGAVAGSTGNGPAHFVFGRRTAAQTWAETLRITQNGGVSFGTSGTAVGTSGQILQSNGDAAPTWVNASTITAGSASLTATYVGFGSGSNTLTGSSNLTWSGTQLLATGQIKSTAVATLGSSVAQGDPSTTDITANATLLLSGVGGNYLSFGQKASNLCQWIQSGYSNPTTATYPISLNPLGGNVGIGTITPSVKFHVSGSSIIANNTSINPDSYTNQTVAGGVSDGSWGVTSAVGGNAGTGKSWAIGHNGSYLYFGAGNNTANGSLASYMVAGGTTRNLWLVPTSGGNVSIGFAEGGGASHRLDINSPTTYSYAQGSYSTGATIGLRAASTTANDYTGIRFTNSNGSREAFFGVVQGPTSAVGDFVFQTYSAFTTSYAERMRVMHNGNVVIGANGNTSTNKFEVQGLSGQLFSVSDSFTGTVFAASDVSGIPSIEVLDTGLVKFAQYNGSVAISTGTAVSGSALSVYGIVSTIGSASEIRGAGEITAYYSSDERLKENISVISNPIEIISQIRGVFYDWTDEQLARRGGEDGYFVRKHDVGVIAQEVERVLPEIVVTRDDGYKAVRYEKLVPLLIESIKSQQADIDMLKAEIENLKKIIK